MKRAAPHLIHDLGMLVVICLVQGWRLTGVPLHECLAAALGLAVFVHLLMQRPWITANVRRLHALPGARAKFNAVLNALLFVAFVAAIVSGLAISKVLIPQQQTPTEFLRWHELHDMASKSVLILVGFHLALNWSAIVKAAALFQRREPAPSIVVRNPRRGTSYGVLLVIAALVVAGAVYGVEKALPVENSVMIYTKSGRIERVPPPQELVDLRKDQRAPNVQGFPKFLAALGLVAITALIARKLLRVHL